MTRLSKKDRDLYQNLLVFTGKETSNFYLSIKQLLVSKLKNKTYLIAHAIRELDSGIREVLHTEEEKRGIQKRLFKKDEGGHKSSIIAAMGDDSESQFTAKWEDLYENIFEYVHRVSPKEIKDKVKKRSYKRLINLWNKYQANILNVLFGCNLSILSRLDRVIKISNPSNSNVKSLTQLLLDLKYYKYFFRKLDNINWFILLYEHNYFEPDKHPPVKYIEIKEGKKYKTIEPWFALDYIENVASKNQVMGNRGIDDVLIQIIDNIVNYGKKDNRINNPTTLYSLIKILSSIEANNVKVSYLDFIFDQFNTAEWEYSFVQAEISNNLLPGLIKKEAKNALLLIFNRMLDFKVTDESYLDRFINVYNEYWLDEGIQKNIEGLLSVCKKNILLILIHKIESIINIKPNAFDYISVIKHPSIGGYDDKMVSYCCECIDKSEVCDIRSIIIDLINSDKRIFKRIAIYAINTHYTKLNDIFWSVKENPLLIPDEGPELYDLLFNNSNLFDEDQLSQVLEWIEQITLDEYEIEQKEKERIVAYRKRQWLKALLKSNKENISRIYEDYGKINEKEPVRPFWGISFGPVSYDTNSPKDLIDFEGSTNEDICKYLKENIDKYDQLAIRSIHEKINDSVIKNPGKYLGNISPFKEIHIQWHVDLISGFIGAWKNKADINWGLLLEFISEIISKENYLERKEGKHDYESNVIYRIADLIDSGASDKEHTFDIKYIEKAENILFNIIKHTKSNIDAKYNGSLSIAVLNTEIGRVLTALVNLSLHYARNLPDQNINNKWKESIKRYFDDRLDRPDNTCIEYSVILGQYLPNYYYLDRVWLVSNIKRIFPNNNDIHWKATMEGYLTHFNVVFNEIFHLLKENDIYEEALGKKYENDNVRKSLVQHICIGYYAGWIKEKSNSNLMNILLNNSDDEDINQIVHAVIRSKDNIKKKHLITKLWGMIYKTMYWGNGKYIKAHEGLVRWLEIIDKIDKRIIKWLSFSIEKSDNGFFLKNLIRGLEKHYETNTKEVGELLVLTTRHNKYLQYQDERFLAILNKVYEMGYKDIGDEICNKYGENERYWVRPVYEKYQNKEVP